MRGGDQDREEKASEIVLPEVAIVIDPEPLRWGGRGNFVTAVGVALLDMVAGQG
jgi:hypothetical protein